MLLSLLCAVRGAAVRPKGTEYTARPTPSCYRVLTNRVAGQVLEKEGGRGLEQMGWGGGRGYTVDAKTFGCLSFDFESFGDDLSLRSKSPAGYQRIKYKGNNKKIVQIDRVHSSDPSHMCMQA